jgi:hypothetical protein
MNGLDLSVFVNNILEINIGHVFPYSSSSNEGATKTKGFLLTSGDVTEALKHAAALPMRRFNASNSDNTFVNVE